MTESGGDPVWPTVVAAVEAHYPGHPVVAFRPEVLWDDGGTDPIDLVRCLTLDDPVPHWLYAGTGLAGFGFELSFRLARDPADRYAPAPAWPVEVLQNLGRYVCSSGNVLHSRDWMPLYKPMTWEVPTTLTSLVFIYDPDLPVVTCEAGRVALLQVIGVTDDELGALREWDVTKGLDLWRGRMPHWVTDPARSSMLADPEMAEAMATGARTEGSGSRALYANAVHWEVDGDLARVSVLPGDVPLLVRSIRGRLPFGNELLVAAGGCGVLFDVADTPSFEEHPDRPEWLRAHVTPDVVDELLAGLEARADSIRPRAFPGFELRITPLVP